MTEDVGKDVRRRYRSDEIAGAYGEAFENSLSGRFRNAWFKVRLQRAMRVHVKGKRFLDIPSGNGRLTSLVQSMTPSLHVGVDVTFEMLKVARERGLQYVVQADVLHLPFKDGTFDVAFCARFLHHFGDDERQEAVKEICRVTHIPVLFYDSIYAFKQISRILRRKMGRPTKKISGISWSQIKKDVAYAGRGISAMWWIMPGVSSQLAVVAGKEQIKDHRRD
jgi:ubiquinone/menaquinone biosynthesis C-methylase UbiE